MCQQSVQDLSEVGVLRLVLAGQTLVAAAAASRSLLALRQIRTTAGRRLVLFLVRGVRVGLATTQLTMLHEGAQVKVDLRLVLGSRQLLHEAIAAAHAPPLLVLPGDVGHLASSCLGLAGLVSGGLQQRLELHLRSQGGVGRA